MYQPTAFRVDDESVAFDFIDTHGFATLISLAGNEPRVSHVPLVLDRRPGAARLLGHVARLNEHWKAFDGTSTALAIFHGPHGYVSPAWYTQHPSVPTWNYAVVHVTGVPTLLDESGTRVVLERLVEKYESARQRPWTPDFPKDYWAKQLKAIVGFALPVSGIEAKFKLSQNRDEHDRQGVLAGLEAEGTPGGVALAAFTRRYYSRFSA
jgi:transcriptional regulator